MKRLTLSIVSLLIATSMAWAGGMVQSTNQSAAWIRMLVRDASTGIDGVFYNPAGLTQLSDGLHFQLNSQTAGQQRIVNSNFPGMNQNEFTGKTFVPVLPSVFVAYKTGNLAVSGGFFVVGGGGSAEFDKGLPSFESQAAVLPSMLTAAGIPTTEYSADASFTGSSAYFAYQANVSYKINDMISVAVGARYVSAKNSYKGYMKNIMANPTYPDLGYTGAMVSAPKFFSDLAAAATAGATQATGAANKAKTAYTSMQPLVGSGMSFDDAINAGYMQQADADSLIAGIVKFGGTASRSTKISDASSMYQGYEAQYTQIAAGYTAAANDATINSALTADKEVDVTQTGHAFTPIFGINLNLMDGKLNIAAKYEMASKMKVKNETKVDDTGMFPDGEETNSDIPSFLSLGANYKVSDKFSTQLGFHYYGDRGVSYGKTLDGVKNVKNDLVIAANSYEVALGMEFGLSENILLSAGFLHSETLPYSFYQSDLSYSLVSNTVGFGGNYKINDAFSIDLGFLNTFYLSREVVDPIKTMNYDKKAWVASIGVNYTLGK